HEHDWHPHPRRKKPETLPQGPKPCAARACEHSRRTKRPPMDARLDATHQTYPGREVPNPIIIDISRGNADITVVLKDILSLTKLNYNTCIFGDGMPITLKFADAIGEILTAGPIKDIPPLPFGHYI